MGGGVYLCELPLSCVLCTDGHSIESPHPWRKNIRYRFIFIKTILNLSYNCTRATTSTFKDAMTGIKHSHYLPPLQLPSPAPPTPHLLNFSFSYSENQGGIQSRCSLHHGFPDARLPRTLVVHLGEYLEDVRGRDQLHLVSALPPLQPRQPQRWPELLLFVARRGGGGEEIDLAW